MFLKSMRQFCLSNSREHWGFPVRTCLPFCLLASLLLGCGGQPEFVHRDEYRDLTPYAQGYVDELLNNYFGTPAEMVVWEKLPLRQHLAQGIVREAGDRVLSLDLDEPHFELTSGTELLWRKGQELKDGEPSDLSAWIRDWDEALHQANFDRSQTSLPEVGTEVILGPGQVLAKGRVLYAEHCQHCHGVSGDGNGPTAPYLNPRPRDYRRGIFKFTTTQGSRRATRDDLSRIIEYGIPGTYMPSFKLLSEEEMTSIVEYVLWLSMRGELEFQMVKYLNDSYSNSAVAERVANGGMSRKEIEQEFVEGVNDPDSFQYEFDEMVNRMTQEWTSSELPESIVEPLTRRVPYTVESIARGRELYLLESLKCAQCHGEAGYGDGSQTYAISKDEAGLDNPLPGLYDTWGNPIKPRNLHAGVFRGGRRPIDLYARIYAGIKGTPMPAFSTTLVRRSNPEDPASELTDEDIWHLVNYIYSVPFEQLETGKGSPPYDPAPAEDSVSADVASN